MCITCKDNNSEGEVNLLDLTENRNKSVSACFKHTIFGVNHPPTWKSSLKDQEAEVG
jgi:hypothetical protein